MSDTVSQIIDSKGGAAAVAGKVGRTANNVRQWKHRGAFPRSAWPELVAAYPDLTLKKLKALESQRQ